MRHLLVVSGLLLSLLSYAQKDGLLHSPGDSLINAAIKYHDEGEYMKAVELYSQVHSGDSNYVWAMYEKALSYSLAKKHEETIETAKKVLGKEEYYDIQLSNLIASSLDDLGKPEEALKIYNEAISKTPKNYNLYFNRALVHENMDNYQLALADYIKAVDLNPYHASSHLALSLLAQSEGEMAPALYALGFFLILEPKSERANSILSLFNNAVSQKDEYESNGVKLSPEGDDYRKTNLLINNYIALDKKYKVDSKLNLPIVKQIHLAIEKQSLPKNPKGFFESYYLPFYKQMMEADHFAGFSYLIVASSKSSKHQKIITNKKGDVSDFVAWAGEKIREIYNFKTIQWDGKLREVRYWKYDDNSLRAIGEVNEEGNLKGYYEFYDDDGNLSGKGRYNDDGEKIGDWVWYHSNGKIKETGNYVNGKLEGENIEYFDNGKVGFTASYTEGEINGVTKVYAKEGNLKRSMFHKDGAIEDSIVYYHSINTRAAKYGITGGNFEGPAQFYSALNTYIGLSNYKEDKLNGPYERYYNSGKQLEVKANYKDGKLNGDYVSYYQNGQIESQGSYVEGKKSGNWKSYYYDGKVSTEENYDLDGKRSGTYISFTRGGLKETELIYSKGEVKEYVQYDRKGAIIETAKRKRGEFYYKGYSIDGVLELEGIYEGDHRKGAWKFYYTSGPLKEVANYNDEGDLDGIWTRYFKDGDVEEQMTYKDDKPHGYYVEYYSNGQKFEEGWYRDGLREGEWVVYSENENKIRVNFYNADALNGPQYYLTNTGELELILDFDYGTLVQTTNTMGDSTGYSTTSIPFGSGKDKRIYPNGNPLLVADCLNGVYQGNVTNYYGTGQKSSEGDEVEDKYHGDWVWYYPSGAISLKGFYYLGQRIGKWTAYHRNGKVRQTYSYESGKQHGPDIDYYENGKKDNEVNYFQDKMHGERIFYHESGQIDHVRIYDHGTITGYSYVGKDGKRVPVIPLPKSSGTVKSYFKNGQLSRVYTLVNGEFSGEYLQYHPDGQLKYKASYKDSKRDGKVENYYPNGKLESVEIYEGGDKNGEAKYYNTNGKLKRKVFFVDGEKNGKEIVYTNGKASHTYVYRGGLIYEEL